MWPILPCFFFFSFLGYLRFSTLRSREEQSDRLVLSPLPPPFLYEVTYFGDGTVVVACASLDEGGGRWPMWVWSLILVQGVDIDSFAFCCARVRVQASRLRVL
jgi:hypothetical protein